jgi:HK97 family phage major capsid protein
MTTHQWAGILRQVDSQKHVQIDPGTGTLKLYTYPVVLTSQASAAAASTTSGPVFGDLKSAMTLRAVTPLDRILRSTEKYAELLQTYYQAVLRADVQPRDVRAVVGVKFSTS